MMMFAPDWTILALAPSNVLLAELTRSPSTSAVIVAMTPAPSLMTSSVSLLR